MTPNKLPWWPFKLDYPTLSGTNKKGKTDDYML